jgi:hypothetical protein
MTRIIFNIKKENLFFEIDDDYIKKCFLERKSLSLYKKLKLLYYLRRSNCIFPLCDCTTCIFSNEFIEHSDTWYSDGEWIWSADLMHYSKKYFFQWPDEFMKSLKEKKYKMRKMSWNEESSLHFDPLFMKIAKKYTDINIDPPIEYYNNPKLRDKILSAVILF